MSRSISSSWSLRVLTPSRVRTALSCVPAATFGFGSHAVLPTHRGSLRFSSTTCTTRTAHDNVTTTTTCSTSRLDRSNDDDSCNVRPHTSTSTPGKVQMRVVLAHGAEVDISATPGQSLMRAIRDEAHLPLAGACNGCIECATCHVFVDESGGASRLPAPSQRESDMLDKMSHAQDSSRLACQITVDASCAGITVTLPRL